MHKLLIKERFHAGEVRNTTVWTNFTEYVWRWRRPLIANTYNLYEESLTAEIAKYAAHGVKIERGEKFDYIVYDSESDMIEFMLRFG